jgi:hypothetical protein
MKLVIPLTIFIYSLIHCMILPYILIDTAKNRLAEIITFDRDIITFEGVRLPSYLEYNKISIHFYALSNTNKVKIGFKASEDNHHEEPEIYFYCNFKWTFDGEMIQYTQIANEIPILVRELKATFGTKYKQSLQFKLDGKVHGLKFVFINDSGQIDMYFRTPMDPLISRKLRMDGGRIENIGHLVIYQQMIASMRLFIIPADRGYQLILKSNGYRYDNVVSSITDSFVAYAHKMCELLGWHHDNSCKAVPRGLGRKFRRRQ